MAFKYGAAVGLAAPERQVLLTQVGDEWPIVRSRMNGFRRNLKRLGVDSQDVFHVEKNPGGTGCHVHAWQWGDGLTVDLATEAATRAGMGTFVDVQDRREPKGRPLTYGLKTVIRGSPHGTFVPKETDGYLSMNGGRLGHASQNFWRDANGERLPGVRSAYRELSNTDARGAWISIFNPTGDPTVS